MRSVDIGKKAPDFTINDVDGNPVSLYLKIGAKALLVDFWAAWHSTSRLENPNVVKVYNEFNRRGFDILGVSLDRQREDWIKAIEDDKLTWTHVSDIKSWDSPVAAIYAVNTIPANFLLDENGIIIAKNIRGEELYNKVKELLERE
jgi:peroxiredoxin